MQAWIKVTLVSQKAKEKRNIPQWKKTCLYPEAFSKIEGKKKNTWPI